MVWGRERRRQGLLPGVAEGSWAGAGTGGRTSLPLTTVLPGSLADRNVRVQKIFNGYLSVRNENFLDAYENSNSTEFANLAKKVKEAVSPGPLVLLSALTPHLRLAERRPPVPPDV